MIHVVPFYPLPLLPKEDWVKLGVDAGGGTIVSVKQKGKLQLLREVWGKNVHAYGRGFPFPEVCGLLAKKSVYTPINDIIGSQWWTNIVRRFLFNRYNAIAAQTEYGKRKFIEQGINPKKIFVMPTPIDVGFFSKKNKEEAFNFRKKYGLGKEKIAVCVGIRPLKNPIVIADACEKAGVKAVMLGAVNTKGLKKAWSESKGFEWFLPPKELLERNVVLTGQLPPEGVRQALSAADVFISSSDYESFGQVIYEAASADVPLCLSNYGSFEKLKECALFHNAHDAGALAKNIKKYLKDKKLREKNTAKAKKIAMQFDYPKAKKEWEHFYKKVGLIE